MLEAGLEGAVAVLGVRPHREQGDVVLHVADRGEQPVAELVEREVGRDELAEHGAQQDEAVVQALAALLDQTVIAR